jgi:hypothetical protein
MGDQKFRELIIYTCLQSEDDQWFGATKLNKLLFNIDIEAYRRFGRTISEQEYQKLPHGPAPRRLVPIIEEMKANGELQVREIPIGSAVQRRAFAWRNADLGVFSPEEVSIIDSVICRFKHFTARMISLQSHDFLGWQLAEEGETIPLGVAFISDRALTREEKAYACELAN